MAKYVEFKLINTDDERIYLKGTVNIDTIDDDEPEFEFEQNDGTYNSHLPHCWKTAGEDLTDAFGIFTQTIDYEMLNQFLADFAEDNVTINFYGNILIINDGKDKSTTIRVKESTKIRLNSIGERGESFDDIINKLIKSYESPKFYSVEESNEIIKESIKDSLKNLPLDKQSRVLFELSSRK